MTTDNLIPDLFRDEGYRAKPYKDSRGFWTGGVGHLLSMSTTYSDVYNRYTAADWMNALAADIRTTEANLDSSLPWWRQLSDVRQDVMVNLAFNLGTAELTTWKHTLGDIEAGRFHAADIDLVSDQPWASQVGARALRLAIQMETNTHQ